MSPRFASSRRSASRFGLVFAACAWLCAPLAGQELPLQRDYPGSGRYQCPAPDTLVTPDEEDVRRAAQVASDANQAMVLGDLERSQQLLEQATDLDPSSADYAFRHALALAEVGDADNALEEYCRALDLDIEALGVFDVRDRIDTLYEEVRERIPLEAREAFIQGLGHADASAYQRAVESFSTAIDAAPDWGAPIYNRGVIYEEMGRIEESLEDYRRYLELAPTDIDPLLVVVSERIGQLEGMAVGSAPDSRAAFALGAVPGMGHYYTGRPVAGTLTLVAATGSLLTGLMVKNVQTLCVADVPSGGSCPPEFIVGEVTERPYLWYGIGAAVTVTLVGAVEVLIKARRAEADAEALGGSDPGPELSAPTVRFGADRVDLNLIRVTFR